MSTGEEPPRPRAAAGKAAGASKPARPVKKAAAKKAGTAKRTAAAKKAGTAKRTAAAKKAGVPPRPAEAAPPPPPPSAPAPAPPPPPPPTPPPPAPPSWSPSPQSWAPPPSYAPPTSPGLDALAITALVLGIVAIPLFFLFVPAILAVVLGLVSRRQIKADPAKGGKGMATAGVVLGILSVLGAIAFYVGVAVSSDGSDESVSYSTLEPGDCYDTDLFDERDVEPRACSEDHLREAFAVLDHPAPPRSEYPGRESLRRFANRECPMRFEAYVGRAYDESRLRIVVVLPPLHAWDEGLRRIVCAAAGPDDEDLTRTVRDSGV